ncbi:sel1 repeat family protein [Dyella dinghuensis]|uniref:Sel1 repeat family protein n=1 Tax=Dyella dinghuensis TaxID=1920169 RepID=A0A432LUD2_9GAMM|nr:sel1 repeat family protein [Dyella dinghuensis]RUL64190.1 sel1 repeat family protein [Dyella dinghuensis]
MKALRRTFICCVLLALTPFVAAAADGDVAAAQSDQQLQHTLKSMKENSTEGHPDLHGQFGGILRYEKGDYAGAMKYFLLGARYADKVSQLSIGLMYLNGQGVPKDPVTGYAWIALSAERNYPKFVETRDSVWAQLDPDQRDKANEILKQLTAEYGDAVAKPRMVAELQQGKLHMTGSPLGVAIFNSQATKSQFFGNLSGAGLGAAGLDAGDPLPDCGLGSVEGGVITGCGDFWAENRWNSKTYFKAQDSFWSGTVRVGALQDVSTKPTSVAQPASSTPSTDEPDGSTNPL